MTYKWLTLQLELRIKVVESSSNPIKSLIDRIYHFNRKLCTDRNCIVSIFRQHTNCKTRNVDYSITLQKDGAKTTYVGKTTRSVWELKWVLYRTWREEFVGSLPAWEHKNCNWGKVSWQKGMDTIWILEIICSIMMICPSKVSKGQNHELFEHRKRYKTQPEHRGNPISSIWWTLGMSSVRWRHVTPAVLNGSFDSVQMTICTEDYGQSLAGQGCCWQNRVWQQDSILLRIQHLKGLEVAF